MSQTQFTLFHLSNPQLNTAREFIQQFCKHNDLQNLRKDLWSWLAETLTANDTLYENNQQRADLIYMYEQLQQLLDAVYLTNEHSN